MLREKHLHVVSVSMPDVVKYQETEMFLYVYMYAG